MPNQQTNNEQLDNATQIDLKQLISNNPYLKGATREAEKRGAESYSQSYDIIGADATNQALQQQTVNMLQQIIEQNPVGTGQRLGVIPSLLSGQGLSRPEIVQPMDMDTATKILQMSQEMPKIPLEKKKLEIEIEKGIRELKQPPAGKQLTAENILNKVEPINVLFDTVNSAYGKIIASAQNPSAMGDVALIFNYMKILDPTSTVREGEFATVQQAGSIPQRVVAQYNEAVKGERFSDETREDLFNRATKLYESEKNLYNKRIVDFTDIAQKNDIDPTKIIRSIKPIETPIGISTKYVKPQTRILSTPSGNRVKLWKE